MLRSPAECKPVRAWPTTLFPAASWCLIVAPVPASGTHFRFLAARSKSCARLPEARRLLSWIGTVVLCAVRLYDITACDVVRRQVVRHALPTLAPRLHVLRGPSPMNPTPWHVRLPSSGNWLEHGLLVFCPVLLNGAACARRGGCFGFWGQMAGFPGYIGYGSWGVE